MLIKSLIRLMALAAVTLSIQAQAAEKCMVEAYGAVFLKDGSIAKYWEITDGKYAQTFDTWEECYNFALQKADEDPKYINGTLSSGSQSKEATMWIEMRWSFDDGVVFDSHGRVTAYTKKQISKPAKGDLRIRHNGVAYPN